MLRILVISLVVANLLLLGFQSSKPPVQPKTRAAPAVARDSGIPTIHLFSEMAQDQGLLAGNRQCFTLGPFHSSEDRDGVHQRLLEVSTRIGERRTEALVEKGYWVFMPPYASLLEANKALLSLQALGLNDSVIIHEGKWKNSISLGYFLRQENALRRKRDLESRGFEPMMSIQRQTEPRYWLDYEQDPGSGLLALDMQNRPNDFMQRPVPCPEAGFPEAESVATQDSGLMPTEPQAPGEESGAVAVQVEAPDVSNIIEEIPEEQEEVVPDQPVVSAQAATVERDLAQDAANTTETAPVDAAGQTDANDREKTVESESERIPGSEAVSGVETSTGQAEGTGADDVVETPATGKPIVAEDIVAGTPPDQGAGDASADAEALPKQSVGTGPQDAISTEPVQVKDGAPDQADPDGKEKDGGDGTGEGR